MMIENGVDLTRRWVERFDIRDSSGRLHAPHGIWTSEAHLTVYVCFDVNLWLGRRSHYLFTSYLQNYARTLANQKVPIERGSLSADESTMNTGAGYLISPLGSRGPYLPDVFLDRCERIPPGDADDSDTAVRIVREQLQARGMIVREATMSEQYRGIDLIASDSRRRYGRDDVPFEVKSRRTHQNHDLIFLQISETNPNGLK